MAVSSDADAAAVTAMTDTTGTKRDSGANDGQCARRQSTERLLHRLRPMETGFSARLRHDTRGLT